ncbi:MAG: tetratricopeptide repeat protein [Bacteroidota bacterium]
MLPANSFRPSALAGGMLIAIALFAAVPAGAAGPNIFCGGAATPGDPADLANVVGDQTLEYSAQQPASMLTCARGYLIEKCGDHETAHKVFDKCIAAGYAGAMIWKALLLEDGAGVPQDSVAAAELLHRAALSGDPAYAPIGKMHYATALHLGRGVAKDEAAARQWFEAAAAEGSEEAREFLKTGYHTGHRELSGMGAGIPTAAALAGPPTGDNASLPRRAPVAAGMAVAAVKLVQGPTPPAPAPEADSVPAATLPAVTREAEIQGQKLERSAVLPSPAMPAASVGLGLVLLASFAAGVLRQRRRSRPGAGNSPL